MAKSIKQQYIDLKEGKMSQAQFMRNMRMNLPQFITNTISFNDTVKVLKNKGIISEVVTGENPYFDTDPSDGDRDHDKNMERAAEEHYEKGKEAYNSGDKAKAQEYYTQALDFGGWVGWSEQELPPYGDDITGLEENNKTQPYGADASKLSDGEVKKKYEMYKKASSHPDFNEHGKKLLAKYEAEYKKRFNKSANEGLFGKKEPQVDSMPSNWHANPTDLIQSVLSFYSKNGVNIDKNKAIGIINKGLPNIKQTIPAEKQPSIDNIAAQIFKIVGKSINELGFTNEPVSQDEALLSIITKYISDPDEAQQELEKYRQKGSQGFSDPLMANLSRDQEFQEWTQRNDETGNSDSLTVDEEPLNENKNRISADKALPHELRMGIRVEMEHTDDPKKAEKIALDHLTENPFYYTMLKLSGVDTNITEKPKAKEVNKKDEICLVDKKNGMKPVKGFEKPKKDAKAKKEPVKTQHITLMSLIPKSVRGVTRMAPTGEKMKKIKLKENQVSIDWDNISEKNAQALFDYHERTGRLPYDLTPEKYDEIVAKYDLKLDNTPDIDPAGGHGLHSHLEENGLDQGRELSKKIANLGLDKKKWDALSPNEKLHAVDRNRFIPSGMRLKAAKMSWEELKRNFDGILQGFAFPTEPKKQGVDLGGSFDKFKDRLKEIIRKELKEITGAYGGDAMDATNEEPGNIDEALSFKRQLINQRAKLKSLYETGEEELDYEDLAKEIKNIMPGFTDDVIEGFLDQMADISEEAPEGNFDGWFDEYINNNNIDENQEFTPENIHQMRDWLKDLTFADVEDIDEFVDELSDEAVIKAVDKHWDGGLEDFKNTLY